MKKQLNFSSLILSSSSKKYDVNEIDIGNKQNYIALRDNLKSMSFENGNAILLIRLSG